MIKFNKPTNLNGYELRNELNNAGIKINYGGSEVAIDEDGNFWLDISASDKLKAGSIVAAHNGTTIPPEPTIEDKLSSVGLSLPDLKAALGL
jgi:hypothetical protein